MDKKKYIDCEAAIDAIYNIGENAGARGSNGFADPEIILLDDAIYALENAPAADVRPVVRGYWKKSSDFVTCSVCKYTSADKDNEGYKIALNFCPNCGADTSLEGYHCEDCKYNKRYLAREQYGCPGNKMRKACESFQMYESEEK